MSNNQSTRSVNHKHLTWGDLKLTDIFTFVNGIKSQSKTKSYPDGHGLVLLCNPQGLLG